MAVVRVVVSRDVCGIFLMVEVAELLVVVWKVVVLNARDCVGLSNGPKWSCDLFGVGCVASGRDVAHSLP